MRKLRKSPVTLTLLALVTVSVLVVGIKVGSNAFASSQQGGIGTVYTPPPGIPGIFLSQKGKTPAFTVADVQSYLANDPSPFPADSVSGAHPTTKQIVFVTSKEASTLMKGEWVGLPDDAIVCYVLLYGPFTNASIYRPPGGPGAKTETSQYGEMVFDGQTGNLIVWGLV